MTQQQQERLLASAELVIHQTVLELFMPAGLALDTQLPTTPTVQHRGQFLHREHLPPAEVHIQSLGIPETWLEMVTPSEGGIPQLREMELLTQSMRLTAQTQTSTYLQSGLRSLEALRTR